MDDFCRSEIHHRSQSTIVRFHRRGVEVVNLKVPPPVDIGAVLTKTFRQLRAFLAKGCPLPGIPPCKAPGVPIDIGASANAEDTSTGNNDGDNWPGLRQRRRVGWEERNDN
jgi:hypothetical protein